MNSMKMYKINTSIFKNNTIYKQNTETPTQNISGKTFFKTFIQPKLS